jgi:hypothetical protein
MAGMSGSEQMSDNPAMTDRPGEDGVSALGYVLESERMRQFARQPGKVGYRTAKRWIKRAAVLVILPVTGLVMVVVGAVEIGPAYAAALRRPLRSLPPARLDPVARGHQLPGHRRDR